ncbi:glutaredoxin family protein [Paenibacillus ginsengarvi]|uniref:Glutaredoxin family protein n=1 Tax=Paenibacillus ginsengarvi TaxID=400777 RepID=A0A3B0CFQ0_9BACL|nr:glutaredoxin family protein [Paenibacillus ginsengarvi]RKN81956.1 glutaredoxin family protein [Paenibacillus ginsengarvi]
MKEPIKIYSIPTCSDCNYAKRYFKEHGIAYIDYNCEENVKYAEEVWNLTGKQVVPTIVIGDKVFVGFAENLSEISELLST